MWITVSIRRTPLLRWVRTGPIDAGEETRAALMEFAVEDGDLEFDSATHREDSEARVSRMLGLIVASREYQFA